MRRILLLLALSLLAPLAEAQFTLRAHTLPSSQSVTLVWTPQAGASSYQVRRADVWPTWSIIWTGSATTITAAINTSTAKIFQVVALNGQGAQIAVSNAALVTNYAYAQTLVGGTTKAAASHITELRTAANAARAAAGLGAFPWSHPTLTNTSPINRLDVQELRTALDDALSAVGLTPAAWIDPTLSATVPIKRDHIDQLRSRLRNFPELLTASASVSELYFSPNGDGVKDTTTFAATVDRVFSTRWTINVRNAGNAVVRTVSGIGNGISFAWNGRNDGGVLQPDGAYAFELLDSADTAYTVAGGSTRLDNTLPVTSITSPADGFVASNARMNGSGDVAVSGTATDDYLQSWTLEAGGTIASGTASVSPAAVLGTWHTLTVANGAQTVRVTATDRAGNTTSTTINVTVGHFRVSQDVHQINPLSSQAVTYTSIVPFSLNESILIRNAAGQLVRTISATRAAGTYQDPWGATNDQAALVPDGMYRYTATATEGASSMTWDETNQFQGGGKSQLPYQQCLNTAGTWTACDDNTSFFFDPYTHPLRIRYCVGDGNPPNCTGSEPAFVTIKATSDAETLMTCSPTDCVMADYQPSGAQELAWYGQSTSGVFIAAAPRLTVIRAYDLVSKNMTIVYGGKPVLTNLVIEPPMFNPAGPAGTQQFHVTVTAAPGRTVTLKADFRNMQSGSVLRSVTNAAASPGNLTIAWDGRAPNGVFVAPGRYEVTITATDSIGNATTLRPYTLVRY